MNSNRSLKSNTSLGGRISPNVQVTKSDYLTNRSSSPPISISNSRSPLSRQQDRGKNEYPLKNFSDDDIKYHKVVFERCADLPTRVSITNREKFVQALNYVGYDLPKTTIDQLWSNNDEYITFKVFQHILNEEKPIDERTLEEAFETLYNKDRKHDWSAIDFDRFRTDMLEKGDRLTEDEFKKLRYLLGTDVGKVDVKKLTKTIGETKTNCRQKILKEKNEQKRDDFERPLSRPNSSKSNSNNNVHIIIDPSSKKLSIDPKMRSLQMKGAFFCEYFDSPVDALYFSIGYSFEIKKDAPIWITVEPIISRYHADSSFKNIDVRILLFEKRPRSTERRLLHMSSERFGHKSYLHLNTLAKGSYEIIPVTFGGVLRARSKEVNERAPIKTLREIKKEKNFLMSKDYRDALEYVFDLFDFDDNKQLDRNEYNLWTVRTTGEEISDDDWSSIREHVGLDVDENVSKEKFLKLNDFEVQDRGTSEQELWNGLKSIGFNYALELDMMCQFNLTVHINQPDLHLKPTSYIELAEIKKVLVKFLENKGQQIKLNNLSVQCYNYKDDCGSILFVENKSSSNVRLSIQVKDSKNVALNLPIDAHKPSVINVRHDSTQLIWFAHKLESL
ncbi:unnamed protein product [Rotaria sordida]|uniref:EF-hand domain-containing protein n=1 Tax=Rotaria sordida TaxID=392033 RepID=A0A814Z9P4_9BILA|nr:unnamed protein product [Rotaria sordida]